jgi:hypothetical protein
METLQILSETAELHPVVLSPDFSEDIFALDLGPLADSKAGGAVRIRGSFFLFVCFVSLFFKIIPVPAHFSLQPLAFSIFFPFAQRKIECQHPGTGQN